MINLTPKSAEFLRPLSPSSDYFFRVAIQAGGCMGVQQIFEWTDRPSDTVWQSEGINLTSDAKSLKLLAGSHIELESSLMQKRLVLVQPAKTRHCSCGESFSL